MMTSSGDYDVRLSVATQQKRHLKAKEISVKPPPNAFFYSGVHLLLYFTRKSLYLLGGEARVMFIKSKKGEEMFEGKMVLCNVKAFPHRTPQEVWGVWGLAVGGGG